jgi:hypothetical protein
MRDLWEFYPMEFGTLELVKWIAYLNASVEISYLDDSGVANIVDLGDTI